jgi:N-acetylglucosamine-6-phosphate deacetylase
VRFDRIVWVGPSADASLPDGVRVFEGRGLYLMSGLADMHVHGWRDADLPLFVAYGVTTVRNMFGDRIYQADVKAM